MAMSPSPRGPSVRVRLRSALALGAASVVGLVAFGWPFVIEPGARSSPRLRRPVGLRRAARCSPRSCSPSSRRAAWTPRRSRCSACSPRSAARCGALGPGTAGLEPSFFLLILGGRVFGRGFGFVLGAVTLFVGACSPAAWGRGCRSR